MLGLMRLQETNAAARFAASAADHLMQQLEGALGGARIAIRQSQIRVDDADEIELGEMVPLGHELRADDDVDAAVLDLDELLAHALDGGDEVAGEDERAAVRKQRRHLLGQA